MVLAFLNSHFTMSEKYKILVNSIVHTLVGAFTTYGKRSRMKVLILRN